MAKKQNSQSIIAWQKENTELIRIHARKDERLSERIAHAVEDGRDKSRQSYILNAVRARLEAEGYPAPDGAGEQPGD